jgi:hypothetical protein
MSLLDWIHALYDEATSQVPRMSTGALTSVIWADRAQSRTDVRFDPPEDAQLTLLSLQVRRECRKTLNRSTFTARSADPSREILTCGG